MKKRGLIFILLILFIIMGCAKKEDSNSLMKLDDYKNINPDEIGYIDYIRLTEAGVDDKEITDSDEIQSIYNQLSKMVVGNETEASCDDNTTIYVFNMKNGDTFQVEIECNWLVLDNKRYEIK